MANWNDALKLNKQVLKDDPKDVDALNRLARAYSELGEIIKAKNIAQKVMTIDPHNTIAAKALEKWKGLKKGKIAGPTKFSARAFLEEPGKTKIVTLLHLGDCNKVLANLDSGDEVMLKLGNHRISVCTLNKKYIGRLPDDVSVSLIKLIKGGNKYQAFIKSSRPQEVNVFIRETKRAKELADVPSFSSEKINYISFTPPELVHKKQSIKAMGIDDED
ncbi:tetratricopeptide repeat protein [Patescibacteria group bacterium]|nr:tetratricopeptide repeat protein [Patescibacteria group bacterium]MBU0845826.1 tetratricopeptide repeat protein [Patescibacteria group bacterium]MBU1066414.1 tetratricopeptide repeat protein [Patescibacteria group bacterium]